MTMSGNSGGMRDHMRKDNERRHLRENAQKEKDLPKPRDTPIEKAQDVDPFNVIFYGRDFVYQSLLIQLSYTEEEIKNVPGNISSNLRFSIIIHFLRHYFSNGF